MDDLVPTARTAPLFPWGITEREKYKIPYKPEFIMQMGGNHFMSYRRSEGIGKGFKEDIFTVSFSLYLDESTEFADIVLPDACYLERLDIQADWESSISPVDEWAWHIRQPVVEPMFQRRPAQKVFLSWRKDWAYWAICIA